MIMVDDQVLRVMHEQFTPDERFGGNAATCTLSTPKDATATHILVFPTSATAQVAFSYIAIYVAGILNCEIRLSSALKKKPHYVTLIFIMLLSL